MKKIPVIAVVGPTASGKTSLAVEISKALGGEVISADSMQIYKGMDIATAKPTQEEMCGIKHHLIDFLPVTQTYSVARFIQDANSAVDEILASGHIPVICGGTGLYSDSLLRNMSFEPENSTDEIRNKLIEREKTEGISALYEELKSIDPDYAATVHINNRVRVIRALEIAYQTGEKPSEVRSRAYSEESRFAPLYIGLDYRDRDVLYDRINRRVDIMVQSGLVDEARAFRSCTGKTAVQAIGYKELEPYFLGEVTLDEALDSLKKATRHYAKRQLTWFRRNSEINWFYPDESPAQDLIADAVRLCSAFLNEFNNKESK